MKGFLNTSNPKTSQLPALSQQHPCASPALQHTWAQRQEANRRCSIYLKNQAQHLNPFSLPATLHCLVRSECQRLPQQTLPASTAQSRHKGTLSQKLPMRRRSNYPTKCALPCTLPYKCDISSKTIPGTDHLQPTER